MKGGKQQKQQDSSNKIISPEMQAKLAKYLLYAAMAVMALTFGLPLLENFINVVPDIFGTVQSGLENIYSK